MTDIFMIAALVTAVIIFGALVRLILGPTNPDRVVAVDTINTLTVAVMILLGVVYQQYIFIDVAIVYALLSFVSTLYIAKHIGGEL
ncbi:Membrane bound hydrogenase subunit mbhB [Methanospirillum hungatei JF-1]|jgi:multicomponent Na+:H+ antiporter subunit F|uniref:Membrane bound hydrogenase subunit mbhB n=1 Tax=Methanospirillum hungatei JF-1 (strain ATCC 27890 / DSM 864 / NBRC 100397 / JF-1) TaxID=323259 RepID=Q2FU37_METHJ|nr:cation:proton antiporter [Methanospirillum hungatei]MBP7035029.1 cation:proton antiporter [Methanospirillum sp.]OQA59818.1 MAG: putative monovalent cation/H+ antiporter subunit F [Euryarchaeota archaeon ADurb.Bin294]ABD42277.1 Membrane bound hydrogenase subunit mbhB [Methanospirillum hungatei JF-1]MBP9008345.1 cation:proton antiporter [Methanospirillum sp.]HOW05546.1 cation:proton antiporter [Methanospirillum hungatei]